MTEAPDQLARDEHKVIWNHLVALRDLMSQYKYLFTESHERVELLNGAARWFFHTVQRAYVRELMLGVARLADATSTGGKPNLTIAVILEDPRLQARPDLHAQLAAAVGEARTAADDVRVHRHKRLAHLDRDVANGKADPLPPISLTLLESALKHLEQAYQRYGIEILDTHFVFELAPLGSVDRLVEVLAAGQKARQDERERTRRVALGLDPAHEVT